MRLFLVVSLTFLTLTANAQPNQEKAQKLAEKAAILYDKGKIEEAIANYKKASELSPESPGPYRELGRCYRDLKQHELAIHYVSEYLARKPNAEQRDALIKYTEEQRPSLTKTNKSLITIDSDPPGAVVFIVDASGKATGIGVTPLKEHPISKDAVAVRFTGTSFENYEQKIDGTQPSISVSSQLDPQKRALAGKEIVPPPIKETKESSGAMKFFGVGIAAGLGAGALGFQFNRSLNLLEQTRSDDPLLDKRYNTMVAYGISSDALTATAITFGIIGVIKIAKHKNKKTTLVPTPNGAAMIGSF